MEERLWLIKLADFTSDDITEIVREAFEKAFNYERDFCHWEGVILADETSSPESLEEALGNFWLEIFHRLDVQLTEEDTKTALTKMDLYQTVNVAVKRTIQADAEAAARVEH